MWIAAGCEPCIKASSVGSAAGSVFGAWLADPMAGPVKEGWMVAIDWLADLMAGSAKEGWMVAIDWLAQ